MRRSSLSFVLLALAALVAGCSGPSGTGDGGAVGDGGPIPDGGALVDVGTNDASSCTPMAGTAHFDLSCARSSGGFTEQIAVLEASSASPRIRIAGFGLGAHGSCDVIDHVTVTEGASMLASFDVSVPTAAAGYGAIEGPAMPGVVAACADETMRFDGATLELTGRTDGGTFTMRCGATGGLGGGWPTQLVLTCHDGIESPMPLTVATYEMAQTVIEAEVPHSGAVAVTMTADGVHVIPGGAIFGTTAPPPFDTTGWTFQYFADGVLPMGANVEHIANFSVANTGDVLGALCAPPAMGPMPMPPPSFIARVRGTTATGPFTTELFIEGCYRH